MADEEALRKIRSVEEQIDILNKKLSIAKQVCDLRVLGSLALRASFYSLTLCLLLAGGGRSAQWDGRDGPSLRGHAGTEHPSHAAAPRKRRRQLQADERADQVQPDPQAAERGEGGASRPAAHLKNAGKLSAYKRNKLYHLGFGVADPHKLQLPSILLYNALLNALQTQPFKTLSKTKLSINHKTS